MSPLASPKPALGSFRAGPAPSVLCAGSGRRFGAQLVRRMALFGEVFGADQALALGLVDQVVPTGDGLAAATIVAEHLLAKSARATELTKMLINAADGEDLDRVLESLAGGIAAGSDELAEALAAFRAKRKPDFKG